MNNGYLISRLIAPKSLSSNDCFALVLSYALDKQQATLAPLRRISNKGAAYFSRRESLGLFVKPQKTFIINQHSDVSFVVNCLPKISHVNELSIIFNPSLSVWAKKFSQYDEEDASSDVDGDLQINYKAFDILKYFLTRFEIKSFTLNFQIKNYNFSARAVQKLVINNCLKTLEVGHSTLSFGNLLILTQIQGLRKIIIHNSIISDQHSADAEDADLITNYSVHQLQFYKNKLSHAIQEKFFKQLIPLLANMKKLLVPTNQFGDNTIDALISSVINHQHLEALFIGSNHYHAESVTKLMTAMLRQKKTLTTLDLTFCDLNRQAIDRIGDLLKENKSLERLSLKGCGLSIQDLQLYNDKLRENTNSPLLELNISLNRVTDMQVQAKFNTLAVPSTIPNPSDIALQTEEPKQIDNPIMKVVAMPITPLLLGIYDCLKMY